MNTGGWFIMSTSICFVTGLFVWCIYKVLTAPHPEKMHGFELETPDEIAQRREDQKRTR